ncbi:MAG: 2Fe-2S iron-sulfur cluster-binding protein, partial [Treponema sp.]|nr:2Fe-2S iron-sulfur cluster-binding protein [Treponema sp.]
MLNITFLPDNITIEKPEGSSLLEAARSAGVFVETPCGGKGTCQKCRVKIVKEKGTDCKEQNVLICQAVVPDENISVVIPESTGLSHVKNTIENPYRYLPVQRETFLKEIFLKIPPPALLDGLSDADRFL